MGFVCVEGRQGFPKQTFPVEGLSVHVCLEAARCNYECLWLKQRKEEKMKKGRKNYNKITWRMRDK